MASCPWVTLPQETVLFPEALCIWFPWTWTCSWLSGALWELMLSNLNPQSRGEEQWEALITLKAHRREHFCTHCARIPCSVGNMMDFVQTSALARSHDMAGKLSISYCECHRSVPYLHFWLQNSWSHFMKQPTIQIGISCSAARVPQLFPLQRPPLQSPSSKQCIEGI